MLDQSKTRIVIGAAALLGPLLGGLVGCAAPVHKWSQGPAADGAGNSDALVFASPELAALQAADGSVALDSLGWSDRTLANREPDSDITQAAYGDSPTPSLDRLRRIYFNQTSQEYIYFRTERTRYEVEPWRRRW